MDLLQAYKNRNLGEVVNVTHLPKCENQQSNLLYNGSKYFITSRHEHCIRIAEYYLTKADIFPDKPAIRDIPILNYECMEHILKYLPLSDLRKFLFLSKSANFVAKRVLLSKPILLDNNIPQNAHNIKLNSLKCGIPIFCRNITRLEVEISLSTQTFVNQCDSLPHIKSVIIYGCARYFESGNTLQNKLIDKVLMRCQPEILKILATTRSIIKIPDTVAEKVKMLTVGTSTLEYENFANLKYFRGLCYITRQIQYVHTLHIGFVSFGSNTTLTCHTFYIPEYMRNCIIDGEVAIFDKYSKSECVKYCKYRKLINK